jgi:hypothetical protein
MASMVSKGHNKKFSNVLWIGFLTGTLDALGAIIWNYKIKAAIIFKFIASGAFGKAAFSGGTDMVLWGVFFHYIIAYSFTAIFFLMYPSFISVIKNKYLIGILFAIITWLITNLLVVPLSRIGWRPMGFSGIIIGVVILIFAIGLPVALIADKLYSSLGSKGKSF